MDFVGHDRSWRSAHQPGPVLAYSFADDDWGTPRAVDAMMTAYPNLTRRHVRPVDVSVPSIGHFGFFRSSALRLWREVVDWMARAAPGDEK